MKKLHYSITIQAPKEKVWDMMLHDTTYRVWSEPFARGSHFVGSWEKGSEIKFMAPDERTGELSGMICKVAEHKPYEFISLEFSDVINGSEDDNKEWLGAHENYTFREVNGATELSIDTEAEDEYVPLFDNSWPKALRKLKDIAEH
jgi:hypothetical protein